MIGLKRKKKKNFSLMIVLFLFLFGVGFSVINATLNIKGNFNIDKIVWDLHFDNILVTDGSVNAISSPIIDNTKLNINFSFNLDLPGDFYEFTVDVVNAGTIDAMIDSISKTPTLTESQAKYLNYIIEYENGEAITTKQLVSSNSSVKLKVRVEYRTDIDGTDLPTSYENLTLGFTVNYIQSDENGTSVKHNGYKHVPISIKGKIEDYGSIVTIGTEKFYTFGTEGENVKLLAMYNLNVGNRVDTGDVVSLLENTTGLQDSNSIGLIKDESYNNAYPFIGTVSFSSEEQHGETYLDYNGSVVEEYVNNYKEQLQNKYYLDILEARIPSEAELTSEEIGCNTYYASCSHSDAWVFSTSYWVMNGHSDEFVRYVSSAGVFGLTQNSNDYNYGVRPLIVIPKKLITLPKTKPVANGDIEDVGTIVTIGSEKFYTIGTEGNNVKLLSMYNLYVGSEWNPYSSSEYGSLATGMQDSNMLGYVAGQNEGKGVTQFSNRIYNGATGTYNICSDYSGSIVEGYVNNYKYILKYHIGVDVLEARLITYDELTDSELFACQGGVTSVGWCDNDYSWFNSTSYWTQAPEGSDYIWIVVADNSEPFGTALYSNNSVYGVRPVIIIPKSLF